MNPGISFDPDKSQRNELERGLPFTWVQEMEWGTSLIKEDTRKDYGERRFWRWGKFKDDDMPSFYSAQRQSTCDQSS